MSRYFSNWTSRTTDEKDMVLVEDEFDIICEVEITDDPDGLSWAEDAGRLMAAAPDLLEACEMALDYFNCPSLTREELRRMGEKLFGAILKAKGKA